MKRFSKMLSVLLVVALIAAVASVSVLAAEPASISVKTQPARTVYYEGVDTIDDMLICDPTGMVITVTNSDGTTVDVPADDENVFMDVEESYTIGDNTATVYYYTEDGDELTTTLTITVKENPVASVKVTKMPAKTEYDMDKDVLTEENFDLDKLYASDPESFDALFAELGMTYEEFKEVYNDPEMMDLLKEILFSEYKNILLLDTTGMEIEVTFKDGTKQTLNDEQAYVTYDNAEIPVMVDQPAEIKEGKNTLTVSVAGVSANFDVTVKKSSAATPEKPNGNTNVKPENKPADTKNPVIPNTDGGVSIALAGVLALVSGCGVALIPSKKKEQF